MFKGVCTALVTPMLKDGSIDFNSFEKFIEFQINSNVNALLVAGTTGEPSTLDDNEKEEIIKFVINKTKKRVPVIVGAGCNCTKKAVENAIKAESLGADAILVVTPYYNKCTQDGLYEHYLAINNAVNIPIIIYNVPGRTGVNITVDTVLKLQNLKNIKALKEASGNIDQINKIARHIDRNKISLLSGDDALTLPMLSLGADGVISVASNVIPKEMSLLVSSYLNGDYKKAMELHFKYADLMDTLFIEVNPIPAKEACYQLKLMNNTVRLPLTEMRDVNKQKLNNELNKLGLIK